MMIMMMKIMVMMTVILQDEWVGLDVEYSQP